MLLTTSTQSQRSNKYYDQKIRESIIEVGDRVLVQNGKLDDKWDNEPFLVLEISTEDIPVYRLWKNDKGPLKTFLRNLLLPLNYNPYTENTVEVSIPKPSKPYGER